ncbi:MAG: hypothetical protein WA738_18480 [Candidatus Angelobacter sp.]
MLRADLHPGTRKSRVLDPKYVFASLCRTYGAHNPMHILPTALPWANLPVRLTARGVTKMNGQDAPSDKYTFARLQRHQHTLLTALPWANLPVRLTARGVRR